MDNKDPFLQPKVSQYGRNMVMTNVSKPTQKQYWNIDTRFHDDYDNYSRMINGNPIPFYTFTLPQPINDVKSMRVVNMELPISFYTISAALGNNVMKVNNSLLVLPDGNYTTASLITAMNARLTGVSYNVVNNKSTFVNTGSVVRLDFAVKASNTNSCTNVSAVDATADFDKFNFKSKLGWILGFRNTTYTIANGATLTSENIVDINPLRYFYLVLDEFTQGNQNSFISPMPMSIINKNILAKISLDSVHYAFGTIMPVNELNGLLKSDARSYNGRVNLQKLKIQLVNEYGEPVNLNGLDFSFCLEILYE